MTEADSAHANNGREQDQAMVDDLAEQLVGLWSDALSIVHNAERMLEALDRPVETAIRPKSIRRLTRNKR